MKILNMLRALFIILVSIGTAHGQQAFSNISVDNAHDRKMISFTPAKEVNIRQYRVEASNDSTSFEVIATIPSKGNSVFPRSYGYDVTAWSYKYYRVGIVEMNGAMPYSMIMSPKAAPNVQPGINISPAVISSNVLAHQ